MSRLIDADALLEKLCMLGVSNAYDRPSFWYGKDKKDYKVIPTKYHNGYDNALADVEKAIQELPTIEERILDKIRAEIMDTLYVDSLIFGELIDFKNGKISADDVIEEFNRVTRMEVLQIIDKYKEESEEGAEE